VPPCHRPTTSTLIEIEAAAENLSAQEKKELYLFLAARLRVPGVPPPESRQSAKEQIEERIRDDEEGLKRFDVAAHRAWLKRTWGERIFTGEEVREMHAAQERGGE
jgi:hypothetical protein